MKKIIISLIVIILTLTISTEVIALSTSSHTATSTATRTAITAATTAGIVARRHRNSYTTEKAIEDIYNETQNNELKDYILENKQYLYLNNEDKAKAVINKFKESNLEETEQFIKDNYYDENKPKNEKILVIISISIIILLLIFGTVGVFIV